MHLRSLIFPAVATVALTLHAWAASELVQLPDFRVEGTPWRYARLGDIEVLTRARESQTRAFVAALIRGQKLLPAFSTEGTRLPLQIVLVDETARSMAALPRLVREEASLLDWHSGYIRMQGFRVDRVIDGVHVLAVNLAGIDEVWMVLVNHACQLVAAGQPASPAWFKRSLFGPCGVLRQVIGLPRSTTVQLPKLSWPDASAPPGTFPPEASELPRFEVMFDPNRQVDEAVALTEMKKFDFQSGLFARWSLFGPAKKGSNRSGYWAFAEMARRGQATEAIFSECYGMDWKQACVEMRAYMSAKDLGILEVRMPRVMADVPEVEQMQIRDATLEEVRRILDDFNRLRAAKKAERNKAKEGTASTPTSRLISRQFRRWKQKTKYENANYRRNGRDSWRVRDYLSECDRVRDHILGRCSEGPC